jgi:hypothetical protein
LGGIALIAVAVGRPSGCASAPPVCTQVIGFSQSSEWYETAGVFESGAGDERWQLLWNIGGGVNRWQDPDYVGWSNALVSPCTQGSAAPDRVLLTISGTYGADEQAWADAIQATLDQIAIKLPSAQQVLLQPVVGGPLEQNCFFQGDLIRASWQHRHIDNAIATFVGGSVALGASPEVQSCNEYEDQPGHLTHDGAVAAGAALGAYYAALDASAIPALGIAFSLALVGALAGTGAVLTRRGRRAAPGLGSSPTDLINRSTSRTSHP